jgi:hypothetical protein
VSLAFDPNDRAQLEAIQKILVMRAEAARKSPSAFLEFVMREQTTKRPIKAAPHQRVGLDFMLAHPENVTMWPAGSAKSFCVTTLTLFLLGQDPTSRGAVVSATQTQAKKILAVVRDYVETSAELHMVYPDLLPSTRPGDPWRDDRIVVKRPPGIPDPSLCAVGIDGGLPGSRLNWIVVDDILTRENTSTKDARAKVLEFLDSTVISRLDPIGGRIIVNNTAWHPDDLVHTLEKAGWATLRMTITGDVQVKDDARRIRRGLAPWDHELLRPKYADGDDYTLRLVRAHDEDPQNDVPLWPERFHYLPWETDTGLKLEPTKDWGVAKHRAQSDIENKKSRHVVGGEFNRLYMNICRDDSTAFCKQEYIDLCKKAAREFGHFSMVSEYRGPNPTFTGVDLAVSPGEENDDVAFWTFEVMHDRRRRILDIEIGQWSGPEIVRKIIQKQKAYNSIVRVENNAAQDFIRQFALQEDASLPVKPHCTGRAKAHPEYGVPGGFAELSNGAWLIPNDKNGVCHPMVQKWIDGCLYYSPAKHTDDSVMAWYFAREQAKEWGLLAPAPKGSGNGSAGGLVSGILSR